ncbi:MAG: alanine--tRNA ligase [Holosporales bacterium]|jgi:alanyl-tRNA synthetase|nr:alanine--tRNA ligase [Holosporales bacterium]
MISSSDLRSAFLNFFAGQGHPIVPSSSLIPNNDPSLLFVNAGMVQFKDIFIGKVKSENKCATTAQKCIRAGGKHNDLDQVGYTARHHTFFEMLGNFSFGDYFKEKAIAFAWEFLTKQIGLPKSRLLVTVYHDDEEAKSLWRKISGLSDERIIPISTNDNFWSMGDTGPCGPCSEIFYDHGEHIFGGVPGSATQNGDRFTEIWNLVFMQFEQLADGRRVPLPKPSIDTGMGLERLAAILQGVHDNYETDILKASIQDINAILDMAPNSITPSHKVVADHVRSICFLLADGVTPSNEGRGYVLRRIIRRAIRHAKKLGAPAHDPFMPKIAEAFIPRMSSYYTELDMFASAIKQNLALEEERFQQTLDNGLSVLDQEIKALGGKKIMPGDIAFKLYDTYGFPLDLTEDILRDHNISVDTQGFNECVEKQKLEAKKSWSGSGEKALPETTYALKQKVNSTVSLAYEHDSNQSTVMAILKEDAVVGQIAQGEYGAIITTETCFYGESGGQVGDIGLIESQTARFSVENTKKLDGIVVHYGQVTSGSFTEGQSVTLTVNTVNRNKLRVNHSATHLLHAALRQVLGGAAVQKGSLVSSSRLRFDFSYQKSLNNDQIFQIEMLVNQWIQSNLAVSIDIVDKDVAIKSGAMALFGDKYGDKVRVVTMRNPQTDTVVSAELCGGLHVGSTGEIGIFKITEQTGIGSNIRRIEAIAGTEVFNYAANFEQIIKDLCAMFKCTADELTNKCSSLILTVDQLEQKNTNLRQQMALSEGASSGGSECEINGVTFVSKSVTELDAKELRSMMDQMKAQHKTKSVIALASTSADGKVSMTVGVSEDISSIYPANRILKEVIEVLGGRGCGGRPDLAQGGGACPQNIPQAFEKIKRVLSQAKI